jgi:cytochrome P450
VTDRQQAEVGHPGSVFAEPVGWADMAAWHQQVTEIRRDHPVLLVEGDGTRFWAITRHADVLAISRDTDHWLNTARSTLVPQDRWERGLQSGFPLPATLVHLDGAKHHAHRQVTNDWFKAAAVADRQARLDAIADTFVAKMRDLGGECDFAADIAAPYTLRVIMDIYGVPEEDEPLMLQLSQGMFGNTDPEYMGDTADPQARIMEVVLRFVEYFDGITSDRRAHPRDDLASVIATGEVDGCPMGDLERFWYYVIIATAGHDTTSFALSGGMEAFLRDPDQLWALRDDPSLVANAANEMIRWTSPVRHFLRWAQQDIEVRGVTIPKDDCVLLSYPSANRDEDVFVDPGRFDIRRPDADKQISFGVGVHFCLGAHFARRELRTLIGKLAQQLDHLEPAGDPQWSESPFVSGVKHLPTRYSFR